MKFLTRHFKQYGIPPIIEDYSSPYDGYFQWPEDDPIMIDDKEYTIPYGAIVFNPLLVTDDSDLCNTIAHEYRHFLQFCVLGCVWTVPSWDDTEGLERYWQNHPCEVDAFSFASSLCSHSYYDDFCRQSGIGIMSRSQALLLPNFSVVFACKY